MEKEILEYKLIMNRRRFLSTVSLGVGSLALGSLLMPDLFSNGGEEKIVVFNSPLLASTTSLTYSAGIR